MVTNYDVSEGSQREKQPKYDNKQNEETSLSKDKKKKKKLPFLPFLTFLLFHEISFPDLLAHVFSTAILPFLLLAPKHNKTNTE